MEAAPLGTLTIFSRTVGKLKQIVWLEQDDGLLLKSTIIRCVIRQQRFIKSSYHGNWRRQWRPLSRHWWETQVGPIPKGYQIFHRDGDSLNDAPENLILACSNRFAITFAINPEASRKRVHNQRSAVRRSNKRRHVELRAARDALLRADAYYVVLHGPSLILWRSFDSMTAARQASPPAVLNAWLQQDQILPPDHVEILSGLDVMKLSRPDGPLERYRRYVPDERTESRSKRTHSDLETELFTD
jgi:hypothetical protein